MDLPILTRYITGGAGENTAAGDVLDLRGRIAMKKPDTLPIAEVPYYQMWTDSSDFLPNLSILDLMMNMGREGIFTLMEMASMEK